ncbi:MAG: hypothetical protein INH41_19400 [Myxococcaceae bacterium]|jgi:hypothetical protein|nr:hypothetical protein [Myxococcaceae bacterium]
MYDDVRLDTKLSDLTRELNTRPLGAGFSIVEAFTMKGFDEAGRPGLFALVLLSQVPAPSLETMTTVRALLTARLKQIDTALPQWPIVVQGAPELIDGQPVVPGGREYFEQVKAELVARKERYKAIEARRSSLTQLPAVTDDRPVPARKPASKPARPARRRVAAARSSKGARAARR